MMKNKLLTLGAVIVVMMALVACGRNQNYDDVEPFPMPEMPVLEDAPNYDVADEDRYGYSDYDNLEDVSFSIERITDEDIAGLGEFSEFEYRPDRYENFGGDNILIRVNQPVSDFTLLGLQDNPDEEKPIVVTERFDTIGEITPDRPLLIKSFLWSGTSLPRQGFTFVTPTGESLYHQWNVSAMDGELNWTPFHWLPEYGIYDPTNY